MAFNVYSREQVQITSKTMLRKTFLTAGLLFAAVCLIGFLVKIAVDRSGVISHTLQNTKWNTSFITDQAPVVPSSEVHTLKVLLGVGSFLGIFSFILTFIWIFRIQTAGMLFISAVYVTYAISQGVGFGMLFLVFNASELMGIFGIAGGMFLVMAGVGFIIKDGTKLYPFVFAGIIAMIIMAIVSLILYFVGVYNDTLILLMTILGGILTCLYTVLDIWMIRSSSQAFALAAQSGQQDKMMETRFIAFFAFRLASDIIQMIWYVARIMARYTRR